MAKKALLPILVILLAAIGAFYFLNGNQGFDSINHAREVAADFNLVPLKGPEIPIKKAIRKVILINFWASWCPPCLMEIPSLVALRKKFADKGLDVALVSVDENPEEVVNETLKPLGVDFVSYYDKNQILSERFDVSALPYTVILDSNLKILWQGEGDQDWNSGTVEKMMKKWLI